ncbi:PREDICTED: uncharacterized protein LOC104611751 [Nelumbo nucifera]|uniref:Uncharacterized protein n=2 Tax=Nelumbo nucifera TaxID=4432 RepID=A0A822ZLE2_NELNU|nr:PREDICTED: uncharacterized protein LOC104611751 [Nelumbo nucifera]DAD46012.1 TPA_asm: hypothetical protein HUJ06_004242 [Nelumbo nucifera]
MSDKPAIQEGRCHVRSISLPSRSHPNTIRIEEELSRIRAWEQSTLKSDLAHPKAESICAAFLGLADLYKCIDELLQMPQTQQGLIQDQYQTWVDEVLDRSVTLLDIGSTSRDILLQMKENVKDLQSALRRRKSEERVLGEKVASYTSFKKNMKKKDVNQCLKMLKRLDEKCVASPLLDHDHHSAKVVRLIREVSTVSISIFQALLSFMSTPMSKPKVSRWQLVSKLMQRRVVTCDNQEEKMNEVTSVDDALFALCRNTSSKDVEVELLEMTQKRLNHLEVGLERLEEGLDCLFRCLIQSRVSLLNALTR